MRTIEWRVDPRTLLAISHDAVAACVAWIVAFWLRLNLSMPAPYDAIIMDTIVVVVCVQVLLLVSSGLYRGIWRYASIYDIRRIVSAVGIASLAVPAVLVLLRISGPVPRSVFLLNPILLLLFMGAGRLTYRLWKDTFHKPIARSQGAALLVLGVNDLAERLVRELGTQAQWSVVGLLDTDRRRLGRDIHGVRVLGHIRDVARIARERNVEHVVLAIPNSLHGPRKRAMRLATSAGLHVLSAPNLEEILTGRATITQLKDLDIEDLLGRAPVSIEHANVHRMILDKTILVTGAGGSIGSELVRQIARYQPARVVFFDISEYSLFRIEQDFGRLFPSIPVACLTGDVKDGARVADVLSRYRPEIVFHAAAYKHVPLMEAENAWEAIRNNVLGTYVLAGAAIQAKVEKFVLISTDKAVNPTNVMGASKRLAEMVCQGLQRGASPTQFVTVRFGNVLGSAGSVVPKFREQIAQGGPITVTHPEVTRFFMSIPEASQLVLLAGAVGQSGEVYVLDMGSPVKIVDLARQMIQLSGLSEADIGIVFTGMRPGEKLYEELLANDEHTLTTPHPKLRIARARATDAESLDRIASWVTDASPKSAEEVRETLRSLVEEYTPADFQSSERQVAAKATPPLRIVVNR